MTAINLPVEHRHEFFVPAPGMAAICMSCGEPLHPVVNLTAARAASEHVALDTLAAENRALTEELAHTQAKLAAAMALADQAVRERGAWYGLAVEYKDVLLTFEDEVDRLTRLTEITDERVDQLARWITDGVLDSDEIRYYVRQTLNAIREFALTSVPDEPTHSHDGIRLDKVIHPRGPDD